MITLQHIWEINTTSCWKSVALCLAVRTGCDPKSGTSGTNRFLSSHVPVLLSLDHRWLWFKLVTVYYILYLESHVCCSMEWNFSEKCVGVGTSFPHTLLWKQWKDKQYYLFFTWSGSLSLGTVVRLRQIVVLDWYLTCLWRNNDRCIYEF